MIEIHELDTYSLSRMLTWKDAWFITYKVYYKKTETHPELDDTSETVSGNINVHPFLFVESLKKDFERVRIDTEITILFFKKMDVEDKKALRNSVNINN